MTAIPIRNIWLLQLFASDFLQGAHSVLSSMEKLDRDVASIVSSILADEVATRLHHGITVGFNRRTNDLNRVRGKIDMAGTYRDQLLQRGQVRCTFDSVEADTPSNRLVRAALLRASRFPTADSRCHRLADQLGILGIGRTPPPRREAQSFHRYRALVADAPMVFAARLLLELALPEPGSGDVYVVAADDNEHRMRVLFEKAAVGLYTSMLGSSGWQIVPGRHLHWQVSEPTLGAEDLLPGMKTDIVLRPPGAPPIILDTKFTSITAVGRFHNRTFKSGHVYQIYAYLHSQQRNPEFGENTAGILLYPVVDGRVDESVTIQGHRMRFATVDLRGSYRQIINDFLHAVEGPKGEPISLTE